MSTAQGPNSKVGWMLALLTLGFGLWALDLPAVSPTRRLLMQQRSSTMSDNNPPSMTVTPAEGCIGTNSTGTNFVLTATDDTTAAGSLRFFNILQTSLGQLRTNGVLWPFGGIITGSPATVTYVPTNATAGTDIIAFNCRDAEDAVSANRSAAATITNLDSSPPTGSAAPSSLSIAQNNAPTNVVLSGSDAQSSAGDLEFVITAVPVAGTLRDGGTTLSVDDVLPGSPYTVNYQPNSGYHGSDSFKFRVRDEDGLLSSEITVSITVNGLPSGFVDPLFVDINSGPTDSELTGTDAETSAGSLVFVITGVPAHGTLRDVGTTVVVTDEFTGSPHTLNYQPRAF